MYLRFKSKRLNLKTIYCDIILLYAKSIYNSFVLYQVIFDAIYIDDVFYKDICPTFEAGV